MPDRAVKILRSKCVFYFTKFMEDQNKNNKHQWNFPEICDSHAVSVRLDKPDTVDIVFMLFYI